MFWLKLLLAGLSLHNTGLDARPLLHLGTKCWTKWHWYRLLSEHFDALQPAPFRHYSMDIFHHKAVIKQYVSLLSLTFKNRASYI